jgi:hypothetical protein
MRFALGRFVFRFGEPGDTDKLGTQPGRATGRCVIPQIALWSGVQNAGPLPPIPPTGLAVVHVTAAGRPHEPRRPVWGGALHGRFRCAQRGESPASKYAIVPSTRGEAMLAPWNQMIVPPRPLNFGNVRCRHLAFAAILRVTIGASEISGGFSNQSDPTSTGFRPRPAARPRTFGRDIIGGRGRTQQRTSRSPSNRSRKV